MEGKGHLGIHVQIHRSAARRLKWSALIAIVFGCTVVSLPVYSQQSKRTWRLGYLTPNSAAAERPRLVTFLQGLRERGYVEGQNLIIEYRFTDGKFDRLPELAAELLRLKVDVLVANSTNAAVAAKNATKTTPIFFMGVSDPIAAGLIDSLPRPGGTATGLTNIAPVLSGKRLELLKETVPKLRRVAVLWDPKNPGSTPQWNESQLAGRELGLQLYSMPVSEVDHYERAFKEAVKAGSGGLSVTINPLANSNQKVVLDLANKYRLPAVYARSDFVERGGLMSYAQSFESDGRDAARLVDKLLKGTPPAEIPTEQPMTFELALNLKTAKALGLTIPPIVLMRAVRVIK
jgi:putative ABC transport system substrate-binding protein